MEFFDIFIFNNVKSDLKIILYQPSKVVFKVKMLPLCGLYHTESPDGQRLGRHIHSKRRIWRFGFDDSWTSQTHLSVKNKATRNVSWVYCIQPLLASVAFRIRYQERVFIYLHIRGAFSVARFGLTGQCEGLRIVERVTDWLHVLLFCIFANKKLTLLW